MVELEIPESWGSLLQSIRGESVAIILGGQHVGKSTLTRWLASELAAGGQRVGLIDADLGQSNVGPPGTLGLAAIRKPFASYRELTPSALFFVGALSPVGVETAVVNGLGKLMKLARRQGHHTILVNTSGYLDAEFVANCVKAVEPSRVVAVEEGSELQGLLTNATNPVSLRPAPAAVRKSDGERSSNREEAFAQYFQNGQLWSVLPVQVRVQTMRGADAPLIPGTLVGMLDGAGVCHGVGIALTPSREGHFRIFSPMHSVHHIQKVLTGSYQVSTEQLKLWMSQSA